jgi:hypothetical protein
MVVCRRLQDEAGARAVMAQLDALDNLSPTRARTRHPPGLASGASIGAVIPLGFCTVRCVKPTGKLVAAALFRRKSVSHQTNSKSAPFLSGVETIPVKPQDPAPSSLSGAFTSTESRHSVRPFYVSRDCMPTDCVADGAVQCELLSKRNSLINRENTGNFFDFSLNLTTRG